MCWATLAPAQHESPRTPCDQHAGSSVFKQRLGLLERGHAGQDLALEELERGAAAGGDVRHLLSETSLLHRRNRVAAADDGDAAVLARDLGERVGDVEGALGESLAREVVGDHPRSPRGCVERAVWK